MQPDPMMQHMSPYLAMSNNPGSFTAPLGLSDQDYIGRHRISTEMRKQRIYSQLTYISIGFISLLSIVGLIFINTADHKDLPLDGLIALNTFLILVLVIVLIMGLKLKRVFMINKVLVIQGLFNKEETLVSFDQVQEIKSIFPAYIDPLNTRIIYLNGNAKKKVYFIKSVKYIDTPNLGVKLGIVQPE